MFRAKTRQEVSVVLAQNQPRTQALFCTLLPQNVEGFCSYRLVNSYVERKQQNEQSQSILQLDLKSSNINIGLGNFPAKLSLSITKKYNWNQSICHRIEKNQV